MDARPGIEIRPEEKWPHRGELLLVMGILSIVFVPIGVVLGPVTFFMARRDLGFMQVGIMNPAGRGLTQAAMFCGIFPLVVAAPFLIALAPTILRSLWRLLH